MDEVSRAALRTVTVMVHKPSLREPEKFQSGSRLYFYATRYLPERISWLCRDSRRPGDGDGTCEVVFSNRSGMSYDEMRSYFNYLKANTGPLDVTIDWGVIDVARITAFSAGKRMGLQVADAVASSFYYAVEPSQYGYTEDRYARMLKPVVWHRSGRYLGYGLKPWPREIDDVIKARKSLAWIGEEYE